MNNIVPFKIFIIYLNQKTLIMKNNFLNSTEDYKTIPIKKLKCLIKLVVPYKKELKKKFRK